MDTIKVNHLVQTTNSAVLTIAIIIAVCLVCFIYRRKKGMISKAALYAVTKAEQAWSSGAGKFKFAEVYMSLKKQFPVITLFMSEQEMSDIIEDALLEMKTVLLKNNSKATS